jgi:hypothetical protein
MRSSSPRAASTATVEESTIPPAHSPSTWLRAEPVTASTASSASTTAPA